MPQDDVRFISACLTAVAPTLAEEEAIIALTRGKTSFGRQTFIYYKAEVATFLGNTGNSPINQRSCCISVNVDTPETASLVSLDFWHPFNYP